MEHPLEIGTQVLCLYENCKTCGPINRYSKINTRIREVKEHPNGTYSYIMLDGREVDQTEILEVK